MTAAVLLSSCVKDTLYDTASMPFLNDELKLNLPVHWINCVED